MRILIADDEMMSRKLLQKTLERVGYEVVAVENGRLAAEQLCRADGPRLALLDWVMPELDGPGAIGYIMSEMPRPIVVFSAYAGAGSAGAIRALFARGRNDDRDRRRRPVLLCHRGADVTTCDSREAGTACRHRDASRGSSAAE